jgi:ABC-type Fe3+-siderophore transport system permease subunit
VIRELPMNGGRRSRVWRRIVACAVALVSYCIGALSTGLASVLTAMLSLDSNLVSQRNLELYRVSGYLVWASGALVAFFLLIESQWVRTSLAIWIGAMIAAALALFANDLRETWPNVLGLTVVTGGFAWATLRLAPRRPPESSA